MRGKIIPKLTASIIVDYRGIFNGQYSFDDNAVILIEIDEL